MTFDEEIDAFVGALRFEREMAENTCLAYAHDLRDFAAAMARRGKASAAAVTREDIADFLRAERAAGRRSSTRARHAVAIRMWLRYLKERRFVAADPSALLADFSLHWVIFFCLFTCLIVCVCVCVYMLLFLFY